MKLDKALFTTFEAAHLCHANVTSIKNWIERGELSAFRTPGGHWRIPRATMSDFLSRHGMANPLLRRPRVLLWSTSPELVSGLSEGLGEQAELRQVEHQTCALVQLGQWKPELLIVQTSLLSAAPDQLKRELEQAGVTTRAIFLEAARCDPKRASELARAALNAP